MKEFLTAEQAYELAANWQENAIAEAVSATLEAIEKRAKMGYFSVEVDAPNSNSAINYNGYLRAMEKLGYTLERKNSYYIQWHWGKPKS